MFKKYVCFFIIVFFAVGLIGATPFFTGPQHTAKLKPTVQQDETAKSCKRATPFADIPLYFIPNKGQVHGDAIFYAKTPGFTLWMTKEGLVFDSIRQNKDGYERDVSRLIFAGATKDAALCPVETGGYVMNYFNGKDKSQWRKGIHTSKAVLYENLYDKIDLKVYGMEKQVEYDWIVKAGANPDDIRFTLSTTHRGSKGPATRGGESLPLGSRQGNPSRVAGRRWHSVSGIDSDGNLVVETGFGEIVHTRPVSYQMVNGGRVDVRVDFKKRDCNTYGFSVGEYDTRFALIIDPVTMTYSTYIGGSSNERGYAVTVGADGSTYITGSCYGINYPVTDGAYQTAFAGGSTDAFVTKLAADGGSLVYSTYLGGSDRDVAKGIACDGNGNAYVIGRTASTDFPVNNAYQNTYGGGGYDAFLCKLSATGDALEYSTYLGGEGGDLGYAIDLDDTGNIYVTGETDSTDFPTLNAYQSTSGGGNEIFVTAFSSTGSSLLFSTYLGGSVNESGYGLVVGPGGGIYVTGRTNSSDYPLLNAVQADYGGDYDALVAKFSSSGSLEYSTYFGGTDTDNGRGIAIAGDYVYVAGDTESSDFPASSALAGSNGFQSTFGGGSMDGFVAKLNADAGAVHYSTYLGGSGAEMITQVAANSDGRALVTGFTDSSDFPVFRALQQTNAGDYDAFVSVLDTYGSSLYYSTYYGGARNDYGRAAALDATGDFYITGYANSSDLPVANAYQSTRGGGYDAFVAKFATANIGTIGDAVDNPYFTWTGGWDWLSQPDAYDDDCAVSSLSVDTSSSDSSYIETTVTGPGVLKYQTMLNESVSCEHMHFAFYLDDALQANHSESSWTQHTVTIPSGLHALTWKSVVGCYSLACFCGVSFFLDQVEFIPDLSVNCERLDFGAVSGSVSEAKTVYVGYAPFGDNYWTVAADEDWISVSPDTGTADGAVVVSVDASGLSAGLYSGTVTFTNTADSSTETVAVNLTVYAAGQNSAPFGAYSTPTDGTTISSSVPFTGWALDDIGVQSVKLYWNNGGVRQYIGDAVFVEGARPDVEAAYPGYPNNEKAGWGYMMLTHFLPDTGSGLGNGTYEILAVALDIEGLETVLGSKTVTVDNASAVKPFGAIDTPAQGGTASGAAFRNNGWVLTPLPYAIATDGSTIDVYVDSVNLGHPLYNLNRPDIAGFFPDNINSDGAGGYFELDTTAYADGVHTISWIAADDAGNTDGVGSRYFTIRNSGGNSAPPIIIKGAADARPDITSPSGVVVDLENGNAADMVCPDEKGCVNVNSRELERIELHLNCPGETPFEIPGGYQLAAGGTLRRLPVGSTLDLEAAVFYWQPGAGFVGDYRLVFLQRDEEGVMTRRLVQIHIRPRYDVKGKRKRKY
ncbi:MAG: hypothetical protein GY765_03275 [bacterium]|nr:hypothetical protein [bacterium]